MILTKEDYCYLMSCMRAKSLQSCLTLCDPFDCQAPLSMGFSRQEYWSRLPCPPGDLPNPGIERVSPALPNGFFTAEPPEKPVYKVSKRNSTYFTENNIKDDMLLKFIVILP